MFYAAIFVLFVGCAVYALVEARRRRRQAAEAAAKEAASRRWSSKLFKQGAESRAGWEQETYTEFRDRKDE